MFWLVYKHSQQVSSRGQAIYCKATPRDLSQAVHPTLSIKKFVLYPILYYILFLKQMGSFPGKKFISWLQIKLTRSKTHLQNYHICEDGPCTEQKFRREFGRSEPSLQESIHDKHGIQCNFLGLRCLGKRFGHLCIQNEIKKEEAWRPILRGRVGRHGFMPQYVLI